MAEAGCPSEKQAGGPFPGPSRLESGSLVLHTSPCRGLMVPCRLPRQPWSASQDLHSNSHLLMGLGISGLHEDLGLSCQLT